MNTFAKLWHHGDVDYGDHQIHRVNFSGSTRACPPLQRSRSQKNDRGRINHANRLYFWRSNGVTIEGTRYPGPGEQPVTITLELAGISVTGTAAFNAFSAPLKNL